MTFIAWQNKFLISRKPKFLQLKKKFCLNKFITTIDNKEYNIYQQLNFLGLYATFVVNEKY
tara:strand:- start:79 stop:261 length:183 start_codon:yes stop_codon:yes gene_type:complete